MDWALQLAGLSKISSHPLVASTVSASQRILGRPKVKKDPLTPEMLRYTLLVTMDFFALASNVI